ncbi:uncharacterized protein [Mytilus edulis]|uniref:uncharacterized protein n=1 Tax=Mytilus edulis TaxID=6550 RepID=UPI0039F01647
MHLLKYMKDTEQDKDWMDLVTISNFETAAKNVKRKCGKNRQRKERDEKKDSGEEGTQNHGLLQFRNEYMPGSCETRWNKGINSKILRNKAGIVIISDNVITGNLDEETFLDTVKRMYCPASVNANTATLEQVRQLSIKYPDKPFRPLVSWMPSKSALLQFIKLINCQIQYLLTAWKHDAALPDFIGSGCLMKDSEGNIQYNFGSDIRIGTREDALTLPEDDIKILYSKKGKKKKRQRSAYNTPTKEKEGKRKAVMSTPIKMKNKQDGAN